MAEVEDDPRTALEPQPTGTIHLWDEGRKYRIRQPRLREWRRLGDDWREIADELDKIAVDNQEWLAEQVKLAQERQERGEPGYTPEDDAEDERRGRVAREANEAGVLRWMMGMLDTLCIDGNPYTLDDDGLADVPVFMVQVPTVQMILQHWRSVPSLSGVR